MVTFSGLNISSIRGYYRILSNLSFEMEGGQLLTLTGPNGCGKTTCLRILAGLLPPESGEIFVDGAHINSEIMARRALWISQETPLKGALSVRENLAFLTALYFPEVTSRRDRASMIHHMIEQAGLSDMAGQEVRTLSSGQKRRVILSLLHGAPRDIWLLDEPSSHLDPEHVKSLIGYVQNHLRQGGIAVISTHRAELWGECWTLDLTPRHRREVAA